MGVETVRYEEPGVFDVIVIGGGFAGVSAAREVFRGGGRALLLEARDRLGGRTWTSSWEGREVELGGQWVHWHQPHTWSEIRRHGLRVDLSEEEETAYWHVGGERRSGTRAERDAIALRGWDRFVDGVEGILPQPYDPLLRGDELARLDGMTIAERVAEIELDDEERAVLEAELESLAHGFLDDAGAVSVLRWHALSGYSLRLTQYTGGRVTLSNGTRSLVKAIAAEAPFEIRYETPVRAVRQTAGAVEVETADGTVLQARGVVVAVPLNVLGSVSFEPPLSQLKQEGIELGQASRGVKLFLRASGRSDEVGSIMPAHPFGYVSTEEVFEDGTQVLIGFGRDAAACDPDDLPAIQRQLDAIVPGFEVQAAYAHNWLEDEYARGTWAIHRPGWYTRYHAEMQRPEARVALAGSDLADGWAGFMDGAIESGIRVGRASCRWIERS